MKGQWVSKIYYAENDKETIKLSMKSYLNTHTYNGVEYPCSHSRG
jgi:hypothetical protein